LNQIQNTYDLNEISELARVPAAVFEALAKSFPGAFSGSIRKLILDYPLVFETIRVRSALSAPAPGEKLWHLILPMGLASSTLLHSFASGQPGRPILTSGFSGLAAWMLLSAAGPRLVGILAKLQKPASAASRHPLLAAA
jgi:hypothetical protein